MIRNSRRSSSNWIAPGGWNFASAYEVVWQRYTAAECRTSRQVPNAQVKHNGDATADFFESRRCFRRDNIGLLGPLQRRAREEVKAKAAYVAAGRLPAELLEQLTCKAWQAKQLPLDGGLWYGVRRSRPSDSDLTDGGDGRVLDMSLGRWCLKKPFRYETYRQQAYTGEETDE